MGDPPCDEHAGLDIDVIRVLRNVHCRIAGGEDGILRGLEAIVAGSARVRYTSAGKCCRQRRSSCFERFDGLRE